MQPTEIFRIALMIGLGVVGYLLVRAWTEDYSRAPPPAVRSAPTVEASDVPPQTVVAPPETTADDVPGEDLAGVAEAEPDPADTFADEARLVRVRTNVLDLWIDRLGGDIVGLDLRDYPEMLHSEARVRLLDRSRSHIHIAQSGLIGRDGPDRQGRPLYAASASEYTIDAGSEEVALRHQAGDVSLVKRFVFDADSCLVTVQHEVVNDGDEEFRARAFAQLKRDAQRPATDGGMYMGPRPYVGAAFTTPDERYEKVDFEDLDDGQYRFDLQGGWAAMLQHYFLTAWIGDEEEVNAYNGRRLGDGNYAVGYVGPEFVVPPGRRQTVSGKFYAGPKIQDRLQEIAPNLSLTVDYGLLWWLSVPLFEVLDFIHGLVGNWGFAIVLLTVLVKLLLYPLASAGFRSMAKLKQLTPQMKRLQERYAGDRQKLSQEMMALYRKAGTNPFGGCLPLLLQMPVFFALYWVLFESVELRQAPFVLWIEDLAVRDPWFVLPLLYGVSFYVMQLLSPPPADPMQARIMKTMPLLFTVLFIFFPAGLVLYWLVNNILSLAQQWYITRQIEQQSERS